ncbi:hypothetical protein GQ55_5G415700 [Panicum hallii var. hallii]|uniref:Uncharacterized protein n=1 Tax=Panicum hallii var. hallii TaxID=1504633 RepID=A0A2T7DNV4_9POAL|nr:hypothetical protein GQ55_5G415700 [Panicum hallii var. hallii]
MSSMSSASSDPAVDLERGAAAEKTDEVNPRVAICKAILDVAAVLYVVFHIGLFTWIVRVSEYWWDPWLAVVVLLPLLLYSLWLKATFFDTKPTPGSDGSDLVTKLLASKK